MDFLRSPWRMIMLAKKSKLYSAIESRLEAFLKKTAIAYRQNLVLVSGI